jgi:hypothetical protein
MLREYFATSISMRTVSTMDPASLAMAFALVGLLDPLRMASNSSKIASLRPALVRATDGSVVWVVIVFPFESPLEKRLRGGLGLGRSLYEAAF